MTDLDDLDDDGLPPHLRRLLDEGSDGPPLSSAAHDRVLGRVLATVGVATVATAAVTSTSTTTAATTTAATTTAATTTAAATTAVIAGSAGGVAITVKAAVVAGVVALAGVTGVVVTRAPSLPAPDAVAARPLVETPAVAVPAPLPSVPPPSSSPSAPLPSVPPPSSSPSAPVPSVPPSSSPAPPPSTPTAALPAPRPGAPAAPASAALESSWEVPQLESARAALSAGQAAEALMLVDDHARRAPDSGLREEGDALRVLALARLGRVEEARAAARAFRARYPMSLFGPRVAGAVAAP